MLTASEYEADLEGHKARVEILGADLGFKMTKKIFRIAQALGLYPKA